MKNACHKIVSQMNPDEHAKYVFSGPDQDHVGDFSITNTILIDDEIISQNLFFFLGKIY